MSPPILGIFPPRGGVGSTFLTYHLAWMYAEQGFSVVVADLDPRADLSQALLGEERLGLFWSGRQPSFTVAAALKAFLDGKTEADDYLEEVRDESSDLSLRLLVGDLLLSLFDDQLSIAWTEFHDERYPEAFRVLSVFRSIFESALQPGGDLLIVDLGPGLGALNRSAWVALDYLVFPVSLTPSSIGGLERVGPVLRDWEDQWIRSIRSMSGFPPRMSETVGYVVLRPPVRLDLPAHFYEHHLLRLTREYWFSVKGTPLTREMELEEDPACLSVLKPYHHLLPMAREARKPIFRLKPADGAIGAHARATHAAHRDFARLARRIADRIGLPGSA